MICKPCCIQDHANCRYPANCPCQHFPSDQVQIVGTQKCEKIFRNISQEAEEPDTPLDMDVLNRLFSAVAHLQA